MKISVIIPVYNSEKYLHKCLNSLLEQDYPDYELILVNDGSTDCSKEICDLYNKKYNCIKVIHQKNAGASAARNIGLCVASGDYVTFVDSDDWVDSDYLSILVEQMKPGSMVVGGFIRETENKRNHMTFSTERGKSEIIYLDRVAAERSTIQHNGIGGFVWSKLFDKKIIDENKICFCENIIFCEDQEFVIEYLSYIRKEIIWIKTQIYHYRINDTSVSNFRYIKHSQFNPKILSEVKAIELENRYIEPELKRLFSSRLVVAKKNALYIMENNSWNDIDYYQVYLYDIRKKLLCYLISNNGQSFKAKLNMIFCCIHPKLGLLVFNLWNYIKKRLIHRKGKA